MKRCPGGKTSKSAALNPSQRKHKAGATTRLSFRQGRHMKYWIDTEFVERPCTIDLISIGLVAEDGREFYAESGEVDWAKASQWTLQTVRPQLDGRGMPREDIGYAVRRFLDADKQPVFWGYFPAYD